MSFCLTILSGQNQVGIMPKLSLSKNIESGIKLQSVIESRVGFNEFENDTEVNHELTDFLFTVSKGLSSGIGLVGAYTFRIREEGFMHRFSQFATLIDDRGNFRMAHRLGIDQSFNTRSTNVFRARYRMIWEKSLNGSAINAREFYLKLGGEIIYSLISQRQNPLEFRIVPKLGYELSSNSKIELGIDHRINNIIKSIDTSRTWSKLSWYVSL